VLDCVFRTGFNAGAAFDTLCDVYCVGFAVFKLIDIRRADFHAFAMPFALVKVHFYYYSIALEFFYSHFFTLWNSCFEILKQINTLPY